MPHEQFKQIMDFNTPLSTLDLMKALERHNLDSIVKVCPWNCIPFYHEKFPQFYIMNTDASYLSGSHWTVIYLPSKLGLVEYFDSFGSPPPEKLINEPYIYNTVQLQNVFSAVCGHYCLLFIWYRKKLNVSLGDFVRKMSRRNCREIFNESFKLFFINNKNNLEKV